MICVVSDGLMPRQSDGGVVKVSWDDTEWCGLLHIRKAPTSESLHVLEQFVIWLNRYGTGSCGRHLHPALTTWLNFALSGTLNLMRRSVEVVGKLLFFQDRNFLFLFERLSNDWNPTAIFDLNDLQLKSYLIHTIVVVVAS